MNAADESRDAATLVIELVTEELPPKALRVLGSAFAGTLAEELRSAGFLTDATVVTPYATPRRLAVAMTRVRAVAPDAEVVDRLMPAKVAYDAQGEPTTALRRKLEALGRPHLATPLAGASDGPDRVYVAADGRAEYAYLRSLAKGRPLARGVQEALDAAIGRLPIPKLMSYPCPGGYYNDVRFVRPAHRLLALYGENVVDVTALGLRADRVTDGHRFLGRGGMRIETADAYAPALEAEGKVLPGFDARRAEIVRRLEHAAEGSTVLAPDALLDEVTALVEWPAVYAGTFDRAYLAVPQECLILTMQQNQRYFALADAEGRLTHRFLLVSNLRIEDPEAIIRGNERVLRARLSDASFFYAQDRKQPLASRIERLGSIVYHNRLGSQRDRVEWLRRIASSLAAATGADPVLVDRAALLAKADLVTDMVGEFPELQGTMGRYYAAHDGEAPDVADAIAEHYRPRFAGDALPRNPVAQALALADKMQALAGLFAIGQAPTGDKDPFGMRRAAIGVLRILIELPVRLRLSQLVGVAFHAYEGVPNLQPAHADLTAFMVERMRGYLRELGYHANEIEAVVSGNADECWTIPAKLAAVRAFEALPESAALAAANKRIVNILRKSGADAALAVDRGRLTDGAEHDLWLAFQHLTPLVEDHCARGDYTAALMALAAPGPAVDRFFADVMVMADDPAIRANRLALLRSVATTMNRVADISKLAG